MPEMTTLLLFTAAAVALIAIPGPNLIYIVTRTLGEGRRAGLASALGVEAGTLVHVAAAAAVLSALISSSATAFADVKYLGAAYLVYLGVRALSKPRHAGSQAGAAEERRGRAFVEGMLVNVLNPKVALFFLAFLPQFVDPARGPAGAQTLVLGAVLFAVALVMDLLYVAAAAGLGRRLRRRGAPGRGERRVTGGIYIGLGALAGLSGGRHA